MKDTQTTRRIGLWRRRLYLRFFVRSSSRVYEHGVSSRPKNLRSLLAKFPILRVVCVYLFLSKPGIVLGNLLVAASGYFFARSFEAASFLGLLAGLSLVIASACVFNNYIDRDIDRKMERTKNRPLARGEIPLPNALAFGSVLAAAGFGLLFWLTTPMAAAAAALGFFIYVIPYSLSKSRTSYATLIGSAAGAMPPVIGYAAASGQVDRTALLFFLLLVLWQMPHFYAIAMFRTDDYSAASIPVLPVEKGVHRTKVHMLLYVGAFFLVALSMAHTPLYLIIAIPLCLAWGYLSLRGFQAPDDRIWAKKMFRLSLLVIVGFSIAIPLGGRL